MEMECVLDRKGSRQGNLIARPVASQIIRNSVSHEAAMLVARCLRFLRASNDFDTFCETAEQEQQLAASMCTLAAIKLAAGCGLVQAARATCDVHARAGKNSKLSAFSFAFFPPFLSRDLSRLTSPTVRPSTQPLTLIGSGRVMWYLLKTFLMPWHFSGDISNLLRSIRFFR